MQCQLQTSSGMLITASTADKDCNDAWLSDQICSFVHLKAKQHSDTQSVSRGRTLEEGVLACGLGRQCIRDTHILEPALASSC